MLDMIREAILTLSWTDAVDIGVVAVLVWILIVWLRTSRARAALLGLAILGGVYLIAGQLGLQLTTRLLQGFMAASVIVVVVVFQEDIRRLFEQIAVLGMPGRQLTTVSEPVDMVVRALVRLANEKRGALVVIPGREPLDRHLEGGVAIDARISEPLLLSIFDPHSPGHDGAVVLVRNRVARFAVHLPLSTDHAQLGQRGTRHAAALGLAERSDALCLVVSEERGTLSVARAGTLRTLARPELAGAVIRSFLSELAPPERGSALARFARRWREAAIAVAIAIPLWVLAVPGGGTIQVERTVPVRIQDLPPGFEVESVDPPELSVTLAGPRRALLFLESGEVEVRVNAVLVELGRRTFQVSPEDVSHPPGATVVSVAPDNVKVSLRKVASES